MTWERDDEDPVMRAFREGMQATEQAATEAEAAFSEDHERLADLALFLGYLLPRKPGQHMEDERGMRHVRWLISHHPGSQLTMVAACHPTPLDYERYTDMRTFWLAAVDSNRGDVSVLKNAARFFQFMEKGRSRDLLNRAMTLAPGDADATLQLASLTMLESTVWGPASVTGAFEPSVDSTKAASAMKFLEIGLNACSDPNKATLLLWELVKACSGAREWSKLAEYSQRLLDSTSSPDLGWVHGNALYYGNAGLGLAALHRGDREEAKRRLLEAARTPGSPQISSFGPNTILARELLEAGERDSVIEYFELCRKFWSTGRPKLDAWTASVRAGQMPDFGANLIY